VAEASLVEITEALADQLRAGLTVLPAGMDGIQVEPIRVANPTPPTIDMYPDTPCLERTGQGGRSWEALWVVRARVGTVDNTAAQQLLLGLIDPRMDSSLRAVIESDRTLQGTVDDVQIEPLSPSGQTLYSETGITLFGAEWRIRMVL
jgi:hypothetical protein